MNIYFIAIVLPEPLQTEITNFKQEVAQAFGPKQSLKSPAHITLFPPFKRSPSWEAQLKEVLDKFAQAQATFELQFKDFGCFPPKVLYVRPLPNKTLDTLHKELLEVLRIRLGITDSLEDKRPYKPHVTVAHRDLDEGNFVQVWEAFQYNRYTAQCKVDNICLLRHNGQIWEVIHLAEVV